MHSKEKQIAQLLSQILPLEIGLSIETDGTVYIRSLEGDYAVGVLGDDGEIESEKVFDDVASAISHFLDLRRRLNVGVSGDDVLLKEDADITPWERYELAGSLIGEIIEQQEAGASPADLLRHLAGAGLQDLSVMLLMQRAFGLERRIADEILRWAPDGSGSLDDEQLNDHLAPWLVKQP